MNTNAINMNENIPLKQKLILGFAFLAVFFSTQGIAILAIPYYQMTLGVDPFLLAIAMKSPVFIAGFLAPLVGQWSDRWQSPLGRRRPFLLMFPWITCIVFGAIWMVPHDWSRDLQLLYFAVLTLIFYLSAVCWTVPLKCLVYESSSNSHERAKLMGFITYFLKFCGLFYHWVFPIAQLSIFGGVIIGMKYVGWGIGLIFFGLLTLLPALFIKERIYEPTKLNKKIPLMVSIKAVMSNNNMKVLLSLLLIQMTIGSFSASLDYYVLVYYMSDGDVGMGATWKAVLSTSYAIMGIISIPVIIKFSGKYGKINVLKFIYILTAIGGILKWFIYEPGNENILIIDAMLCCYVWVGMGVLVSAMIADQIDHDEKVNNIRREGIFVSLQNWIMSVAGAIAIITSGLTLNLIGFDALEGANQTSSATLMMRILLSGGTFISAMLGYFAISYFKEHK